MALSNEVWTLLSGPTVLKEMEKDPKASPIKIAEKLFGKKRAKKIEDATTKNHKSQDVIITQEDLDRAATTGRFRTRPSDLFLKVSMQYDAMAPWMMLTTYRLDVH
jgi:hypothetical protein